MEDGLSPLCTSRWLSLKMSVTLNQIKSISLILLTTDWFSNENSKCLILSDINPKKMLLGLGSDGNVVIV